MTSIDDTLICANIGQGRFQAAYRIQFTNHLYYLFDDMIGGLMLGRLVQYDQMVNEKLQQVYRFTQVLLRSDWKFFWDTLQCC